MNYIDIHTHLLFGMDDGAKTIEQTIELLERAYNTGTRVIFFTPHNNRAGFDLEKAREGLEALAPIAKTKFPDLKFYGGCEMMYSPSTLESVITKQLPTLAGSEYLLTEFMPGVFYSEMLTAVRSIVSKGLTPIVAHAERYGCLYKEGVAELIKYGALIQLNANSVIGKRGFGAKRFCKKLIKKDLVHFIASDSHDGDRRAPELDRCEQYVTKKFGQQTSDRLFWKNANMIIDK